MGKAVGNSGWLAARWHCLGLAFFWASSMLTFRSSILLTGAADTPESNTFVVVVSFVANMTVLFAISALVEKASESVARIPSWTFCAAILVGFVLIRVAGEPSVGGAMPTMLFLGALLCGIGFGYFWGSWADVLGRVHPSTTTVSIPASFLLTAVLFVVVTLCVSFAHVPGILPILPLPVLSLACLEKCRRSEPAFEPAPASRRYIEAVASLVPLIIASLVLSCLFGFMWETAVLSTDTATQAHELPLVANVAAATVLLVGVLVARRKVDLTLVYQVLIPISILSFIAIPFLWHDQPVALNAVISAIYGVFDVIIWYMVVSCSYDFSVSGFVVGGIVRGISLLSRLVGIGIGSLIMMVPDASNGAMVGMSIGAVYILAMLLWFLYRNSKQKAKVCTTDVNTVDVSAADLEASEEEPPAVGLNASGGGRHEGDASPSQGNASEDDEEKFRLIAEDYGLTRREAEVLPYLARGRSAKVIADALFVSEPTIRTHTRHILEKTCLHSKQELIDLIDRY